MRPQIQTILFAAGLGNDTGYVLRYAIDLAMRYQARIQIIHSHEALNITSQNMAEIYMFQDGMEDAFELSLLEAEAKIKADLKNLCRQELEKFSAPAGLVSGIHIARIPPRQAILNAAKELQADLIVIGSHRHSVLTDALLGSTTMKILHSSAVPVFVVRIPEQLPAP